MPDIKRSLLKEEARLQARQRLRAPGQLEQEDGRRVPQARRKKPRALLGEDGEGERLLVLPLEEGSRLEAALREVVRRRQAQRLLQLPRSPPRRRERLASKQGRDHLGGRARRFQRVLTYAELHREVCRFANVLKGLGVKKGDRVALYMPMIPELAIAMLACTRIGARTASSSVAFRPMRCATASTTPGAKARHHVRWRLPKGRPLPLKPAVDDACKKTALRRAHRRRRALRKPRQDEARARPLVARTDGGPARSAPPRSSTPSTRSSSSTPVERPESRRASCTRPAATSPTSRRRQRPSSISRTRHVYWCTADIGWMTGHSYVVYGPLSNGATT